MRVIRLFTDVSMSNGHLGLAKLARNHRIQIDSLDKEFVVFLNKAQTSFKLYAPGNIICHYRGTRKVDLRAIQHLPRVFNGHSLNYDRAVQKVIEKEMALRGKI